MHNKLGHTQFYKKKKETILLDFKTQFKPNILIVGDFDN